jgi:hypothetical protein
MSLECQCDSIGLVPIWLHWSSCGCWATGRSIKLLAVRVWSDAHVLNDSAALCGVQLCLWTGAHTCIIFACLGNKLQQWTAIFCSRFHISKYQHHKQDWGYTLIANHTTGMSFSWTTRHTLCVRWSDFFRCAFTLVTCDGARAVHDYQGDSIHRANIS